MKRKRALRRRYGRAGSTNSEGLTLSEWTNAANAFGKVIEGAAARKGWSLGEDPTEYASLASRGMKIKLVGGRLVARKG
jgi:hypothetical protein